MNCLNGRLFAGLICIATLNITIGCGQKPTTKAELVRYVKDPQNSLSKSLEINAIRAELSYQPVQLMHGLKKGRQSPVQFGDKFKNRYFFVFSLSSGGKELLRQLPAEQYSAMVQRLAFRMVEYIVAVTDQNKLVYPMNCLFQQTFGAARANQIILVFDSKNLSQSRFFKIKINEFGLGIGDLDYKFNTKDINDLSDIVLTQ